MDNQKFCNYDECRRFELETELLETQQALSEREAELKAYKEGTLKSMYRATELDKIYQAAVASGEGWREVAYDLGYSLDEALKRESGANAKVDELKGIVRRNEWIKPYYKENADFSYCPSCSEFMADGHVDWCDIGAALKEQEDETD